MYLKIFLKFILVSALAILQISFVSALPLWLRELNLMIVFLIFSLEWSGGYKTVWWFLLIGFIFDLYFPLFFGFFILLWPIIFLLTYLISTNFFTNRSLYSFLSLTFFATATYYFIYNVYFYFASFFSGKGVALFFLTKNFWLRFADGLILNLIAVFILFYLTNVLSDKFKPVFMIKKQH
jgi:hypothetical protein